MDEGIMGEEPKKGLFQRLKDGLSKTREGLARNLGALLGTAKVDEALLEDLEAVLIAADFGVHVTRSILDEAQERLKKMERGDGNEMREALKETIRARLQRHQIPSPEIVRQPHVILVVGVNGVGKTTTIGKMAAQFVQQGNKVMLAAGDTFRAAAVEQLKIWGQRAHCPVVAQGQDADSASVIFDAYSAAKARGVELLIADTAGRLHTKVNLMEELKKVQRVLKRQDPEAPHEVLLVLDATTGQNALSQARQFHRDLGLTGLVITKLDGTAKGGVVVGVCEELNLPVRFIGVGEGVEDLRPFEADPFVEALFGH
ncbi:MAG: signal recognition particle-docking protein FtsY [Magnetococcales bacterium]|nr:signal recognition particle-docking protein FtsY [Magnetococcales bacterium]